MFKLVVLSVFIAFAFGLPKQNELPFSSRIVGGENATIEDYPYQVSILYKDEHICGGAILNRRKIVTSLNCLDYWSVDEHLKVRAGSSILNSGGIVVDVLKVYKHPYFDKTPDASYDYDVAIVELISLLTFSESIQPIGLHTVRPKDRIDGIITGWGYTDVYGPFSEQLQVLTLPILNNEFCHELLSDKSHGVTDRMFCAGIPLGKTDACYGDYGGPFVVDGKLAGILSWGMGCESYYTPIKVYSSVPALYDFIGAHL